MMNDEEFIKQMRVLELDHEPTGWPCVQMKQITRLLDTIKKLEDEIDDLYYQNAHRD